MVLKSARLVLCVLMACDAGPERSASSEPQDDPTRPSEPTVGVETTRVGSSRYPVRTIGEVQPATSHVVSIGAPGRVRSVHVDVGDRVAPGAVLLRLDEKRDELQVDRAKAQAKRASVELTRAEQELVRIEALRREGVASAETLEQAQARVDLARAATADAKAAGRLARHERGEAVVRAPAAGVVTQRNIEDGERALPGEALLIIESDALEVETWISERDVGGIAVGDDATVAAPGFLDARVSVIDRHAQGRTGNFGVRLELQGDADVRPGQTVEVTVEVRTPGEVITIPEAALVSRERRLAAFVVDQGRARRVFVRLGPPQDGRVPVLEGIAPGSTVVVDGVEGLVDGQAVVVAARGGEG